MVSIALAYAIRREEPEDFQNEFAVGYCGRASDDFWGSGVGRIELEHAKIAQHAHTNKREQINAGLVDLTKSLAHILIASGLVEGPRMAKRKPKIIRKPVAPPINEW